MWPQPQQQQPRFARDYKAKCVARETFITDLICVLCLALFCGADAVPAGLSTIGGDDASLGRSATIAVARNTRKPKQSGCWCWRLTGTCQTLRGIRSRLYYMMMMCTVWNPIWLSEKENAGSHRAKSDSFVCDAHTELSSYLATNTITTTCLAPVDALRAARALSTRSRRREVVI